MKFDLTEKDVRLVDGKFVQLPMKRFVALTEYVENLESRLLSAAITPASPIRQACYLLGVWSPR